MASSYLDKYKGVGDRLSVYDILQRIGTTEYKSGETKEYRAVDIEFVKIDGNEFRNYGAYSFIWEKTYVTSPERSTSGSIGNLDSYATFLTPHLIIDFSVMSIDDYRKIMLLHYGANEFTVECYDPIYNQTIAVKMYFATEEVAKLYTIAQRRFNGTEWEEWVDLVGVTEYKVELIGTNNDIDLVSVVYHLNPPSDTGVGDYTVGEESVYRGEDVVIGSAAFDIIAETFGSRYVFSKWNTAADGSGISYTNNYAKTINNNIVLYAQWSSASQHTLTFNYGLADPTINDEENLYETSRTVEVGASIGALPIPELPTVTIGETTYTPYYNGKWYKTPIKTSNSRPLTDGYIYWAERDATIYWLCDVFSYQFTLILVEDGVSNIYSSNNITYGTALNIPQLYKSGYTFDGWYTSSDFAEKFEGNTMPPYNTTLYARWVEE